MTTVAVLHPGEMGTAIATGVRAGGHRVVWSSEGRSRATHQRAELAGLDAVADLASAVLVADVILSVCPPDAAFDVAVAVADLGFSGVYVDANAVAPSTAGRIALRVAAAGADYVDAGIIGGPSAPRLFLAGARACEVADLFPVEKPVTPVVLNTQAGGTEEVYAASALKMVYAAWSKGTTALLVAVAAAADGLGVASALHEEWARSQPGLQARLAASAGVARKAWRWEGEMNEIAETLRGVGLPDGFHLAAAEIYARMAEFKDAEPPSAQLQDVLRAVRAT